MTDIKVIKRKIKHTVYIIKSRLQKKLNKGMTKIKVTTKKLKIAIKKPSLLRENIAVRHNKNQGFLEKN